MHDRNMLVVPVSSPNVKDTSCAFYVKKYPLTCGIQAHRPSTDIIQAAYYWKLTNGKTEPTENDDCWSYVHKLTGKITGDELPSLYLPCFYWLSYFIPTWKHRSWQHKHNFSPRTTPRKVLRHAWISTAFFIASFRNTASQTPWCWCVITLRAQRA